MPSQPISPRPATQTDGLDTTPVWLRQDPPYDLVPFEAPINPAHSGRFYGGRKRLFESDAFVAYGDPAKINLPQSIRHSDAMRRLLDLNAPASRTALKRPWTDDDLGRSIHPKRDRAIMAALHLKRGSATNVDDPFAGTDLVVVHDDYVGDLPLNAVRASEYRRAREQLEAIRSGRSMIRLEEAYGKPGPDRDAILQDITILLTRRIGRELFARLEAAKSTVILVKRGRRTQYLPRLRLVCIERERPAIAAHRGITPAGRMHGIPAPRFISLAHELIHRLHHVWTQTADLDFGKGDDLFIPECMSIGEQHAITGWRLQPTSKMVCRDGLYYRKLPDGTSPEEQFAPANIAYTPINEWAIQSAFWMPWREDHFGWSRSPPDFDEIRAWLDTDSESGMCDNTICRVFARLWAMLHQSS